MYVCIYRYYSQAKNKERTKEQAKVAATEKPVYLIEDMARKINDLDREVKYLLNKAKTFRPKVKPIDITNTTDANSTKTGEWNHWVIVV